MPSSDFQHWCEQAATLRQQARFGEALNACRRAIECAPDDSRAWSELAHALRLQGSLSEARTAADRAVELGPGLASAWFNLAAVLLAQGDITHSIEANRKAIELEPGFAEAWSNLGGALAAGGDRAGEIEAYRRALEINPRLAPVWSNLGNALREAGQLEESISACNRSVGIDPNFAAAWNNLGNSLREHGEHEKAIEACKRSVQLAPQLAEAWSSLGLALNAARRYVEALTPLQKAIRLQPSSARVNFILGVTFQYCGRQAEAIEYFHRAIQMQPDYAQAHWNLSVALLSSGQLREGWEEYEWRWQREGAPGRRYEFAIWNGDASEPLRLLLWGEQGIGDQIIYGSMIPDLVSSPMTITLEVDPRLAPLYRRSFPQLSVLPRQEPPAADPAAYDCQAPLASLGRWLRPSFQSFPQRRGFLKPDPVRIHQVRQMLSPHRAIRTIGISWRSSNREFGESKSMDLCDWLDILRVPRARFIDLQYGDTRSERARVEQEGMRVEHLPDIDVYNDLEGLAALCASCDLVVTASNVTAHIAGALGCPVWLFVPKGGGRLWYWFSDRTDSPWYPATRIFSQHAPGSWRETLSAVAQELAAYVGSGGSPIATTRR